MTRSIALLVLPAVLVLAAACGGGEEAAIKSVVRDFFSAFEDRDANKMAGFLSADCANVEGEIRAVLGTYQTLGIEGFKFDVTGVDVRNLREDSAEVSRQVKLSTGGDERQVGSDYERMVKEDGEWKFDDCDFFFKFALALSVGDDENGTAARLETPAATADAGSTTDDKYQPFPMSTSPVDVCQDYDEVAEECMEFLSGAVAVSAGGSLGAGHTCALTIEGGVKCWGRNYWGQLGDGTTTERHTPVDVLGLGSDVAAVAAGTIHICALTTAGGVKCWGANIDGQLGDGTTAQRTPPAQPQTPVDVVGLTSGVAAIAAGSVHTCAVTIGGGVKCWGLNEYGQLGDGTTADRTTPMDVSGLTSGVAAIAAGGGFSQASTCIVTTAGGVKCWGAGGMELCGDSPCATTPVDVPGLANAAAVVVGRGHACALTAAGGVKCWGDNIEGELGDGGTCLVDCTTPVDVVGLQRGVTAIAAGYFHTCALTTAGDVKCWGENGFGQLGDGTGGSRPGAFSTIPVDVSALTDRVTAIAAGDWRTCAVTIGGGVKCWGLNEYGQLGDGLPLVHTP